MLVVRSMERKDYSGAAKLIQGEIYGINLSPEKMEQWLNAHLSPISLGFVAEEQGELVGAVIWILYDLWGEEFSFELSWIAIEKAYQGKGIGKLLLQQSFKMVLEDEEYRKSSPACIILDVDADNERALKFYREWLQPFQEVLVQSYWKKGGVDTYFLYVRPENLLQGDKIKGGQ